MIPENDEKQMTEEEAKDYFKKWGYYRNEMNKELAHTYRNYNKVATNDLEAKWKQEAIDGIIDDFLLRDSLMIVGKFQSLINIMIIAFKSKRNSRKLLQILRKIKISAPENDKLEIARRLLIHNGCLINSTMK